jgi:signal transduction histidine kinase/CheY-like chemotaxis protein
MHSDNLLSHSNQDQYGENLAEQRSEALSLAQLLAGGLLFVWFAWLIWPITGKNSPPNAWYGSLILAAGLGFSYHYRIIHPRRASLIYLWGMWLSIQFVVRSYPELAIGYLFFAPLILAGLLVEQRDYWPLALACLASVLWLGLYAGVTPAAHLVAQVMGILLLTFTAWMTDRNMKIVLTWIWKSYEKALASEQMARQGKADLERALSSLDEVNSYLEQANRQLAIVRDQAIEARQLKQQFAQTISHELRTPLNLIVGFTELMVKSPEYYKASLPPAYMRDLNIVYRNALHLQSMVNDVLDLARIEAAQLSLVPELVNPSELVSSLTPIATSLSHVYHLPFQIDCEPALPELWIDPTRIRQVLLNLVNNAYRFTGEGSVRLQVCRVDEGVVFSVTDTGVGISAEQQEHIFDEFYQVDGSTRRKKGGTGLGLAISKRFVELHGGRIWVESEPGKGSTFSFLLPAYTGALIPRLPDSSREEAAYLGDMEKIPPELLVISPSLSAAIMFERYIKGIRVISAQDLSHGQMLARQTNPRVILFDALILNAQLNLAEIAQNWELANCTLVSCPLPGGDDLATRLNISAYLVKPITKANLSFVLENVGAEVKHVMVIDDNRDFVRLINSMLSPPPFRCRVTAAYSAEEGLAMLARLHVDAVLLDLNLPDGNGLTVLEHMRANPRMRKIPVVIVSALDQNTVIPLTNGEFNIYQAGGFASAQIVQWVNQVIDLIPLAGSAEKPQRNNPIQSVSKHR